MLEKGDKIGDYTLVLFLGKGQFGEVWLAEKHLQFSSRKFRHALKFLSNLGDGINLKSAEAEIDTWIEVSGHPNVMSVLDMLVHKEHIIIASEYAEGGSLRDWLNESGGKAPSTEKALKMMAGILNGIEHLHSRSVIHRDLKPDNILLQGNFPRITDFGISRIVSSDSLLTKVIGSPAYMSPESFDGIKSPQIDIWSAGIMFYEMLTGEHPFYSETIFGLVAVIQREEPKPLPEHFPQELRDLVGTALQRDLTKRFQTARDMRVAIELATHNLKVRSKSHGAVTEVLPNVGGYVDAHAMTEPNIEKFGMAASGRSNTVVADVPLEIEPFDDTQISEVINDRDAFELETKTSHDFEPSLETFSKSAHNNNETAPPPVGTNPMVIIGSIAGVLIFAVVVGLIGLIPVTKAIFSGAAGADSGSAANGAIASNAKTISPIGVPPRPSTDDTMANAPDGMVYIVAGEFAMGRDDGSMPDEQPTHTESVMPFFIDIYEVTNEKYAQFVSDTGHPAPPGWRDNTYPNGKGNYPVVGVNWNDASQYAKWAGKRLPTEKEWEYAARGKDGFLYPWGDNWKPGNANAGGESPALVEVGRFKGASPFGIYDMVGNAGEWTADDFKAYANGRVSPAFEGKANLKTIRGNDFAATKDFATTTFRIGWAATGAPTYSRTGFRCAKDVAK